MKKNAFNTRPASTTLQSAEQAPILRALPIETGAQEQEQTEPAQEPEQPAQEQPEQQPAPAAEVAPVVVAAAPAPAAVVAPVVVAPAPMPLNQIQEKVRQMKTVSDRLDFLIKTSIELSEFTLGRTGLTDSLQIQDGAGKIWKTNKSDTIQKVLDLLCAELGAHIEKSEQDLRGFLAA